YQDDVHFYYIILKPNGWELGKEDPAYPDAQRFLATGNTPQYPIGSTNSLRVVQVGATITISANGTILTTFTDTERPYTGGALGLYCEDARVHFGPVAASPAS
ncbi:MAG: calcium-binding protein, partial [Candidatus Eremiobacteraeota bacterium]|nr:calcium-binding protein [Candidatus Eremiobacteraeota bacterium]